MKREGNHVFDPGLKIFVECDKSPTSTMKSLKKLVSSLRTVEDSAVPKIDREFETDPL